MGRAKSIAVAAYLGIATVAAVAPSLTTEKTLLVAVIAKDFGTFSKVVWTSAGVMRVGHRHLLELDSDVLERYGSLPPGAGCHITVSEGPLGRAPNIVHVHGCRPIALPKPAGKPA